MRRFSLYRRNHIYYARFWNEQTRKYTSGRSTGERTKRGAEAVVAYWDKYGFPDKQETIPQFLEFNSLLETLRNTNLSSEQAQQIIEILMNRKIIESVTLPSSGKDSEPLAEFLHEFWNYETSPYVKEKLAYGQSIGRRHCYEQQSLSKHWKKFFGDSKRIKDLTREDIQQLQMHLKLKHKMVAKSVNNAITVGSVAFKWLKNNGHIETDPFEGLRKFSSAGERRKRDAFSVDEAKDIFSTQWGDERARIGNLLAATTGMRAGEVVALQRADIGTDRVFVRHSWGFEDGLKTPKNGETREVPLTATVRDQLLRLADRANAIGSDFLFYGPNHDKPMNIDRFNRYLAQAYIDSRLSLDKRDDENERKKIRQEMLARRLSFHSWRHFYAARVSDHVELRTVQLATGHRSAAMAEHYAAHKTEEQFRQIADATTILFSPLIQDARTDSQKERAG